MFFVNSDGKRTGGCIFIVLLLLHYRASSTQFTPKYQGKTVTGLVGSSVNFTWSFFGDVTKIEWAIKNNGADALNDSTLLITIDESGLVVAPVIVTIPAAYSGRVSGARHGNSSSFQAVFTLSSIIKEDENDYGCLITYTRFFQTITEFDYMQLVVEEEPSFTHPTQTNATYNEGNPVDIICAAQGTLDPDVRWIYNGQEKSSGSKTSHLIFSPISKTDAGMYTCRANNSVGIKEKQLHIVVNYPAIITNISSSISKSFIGQTVTLTCKSDGVPTPTLSWYRPNGTKFKAKENAVVPLNSDGDFGHYNCTAFNGFLLASMTILVEQIKAPGAPIVASAEADIQATSLTVKWTEPTDTGGSPITAYRVVILKGVAEIKNDNITDPAKRSWPVENLEMNTNYTVKVFARNYVFEGNAIKKTFQTKFEGIPAAAEIIDLPADTKAGEVIIKWNTPKDNGATITQYTVYKRTVSDDGTPRNWIRLHTITAAVSVRQVAVKLDKGKIYEFVVTATNKRGESSKEEEKIKRIKVGDVPEAVVVTSKVNDGEITLKWKEPDNNGAAIIQYDVYQRIVKDKWKNIGTIKDTCKLEFVVEGEEGKEYEFAVTATSKYGESSKEDSITKAKVPGVSTTPTESQIGSDDEKKTLHAVYMTVILLLLISNLVLIHSLWKKRCRSVKPVRGRKCSRCGDLTAMKPLLKTDQVEAETQFSSEAQKIDAPTYAVPVGADYMPLNPSTKSWEIGREDVTIIKVPTPLPPPPPHDDL